MNLHTGSFYSEYTLGIIFTVNFVIYSEIGQLNNNQQVNFNINILYNTKVDFKIYITKKLTINLQVTFILNILIYM